MSEVAAQPLRVPPRLVLASIVGLWACYFLLATLRGAVVGLDFSWALVSRRLLVCLASIAVTAMLWPMLVAMARRSLVQRAAAVMVVGLPVSVLLTAINGWAFAGLDHRAMGSMNMQDGVSILHDDKGNMVIDVPGRGRWSKTLVGGKPSQMIVVGKHSMGFWTDNADVILGRYFLLLAWAAIYLALASAEQARAAERREGEYRRAAQVAELRSLRHQINPHFLFNTLNSLSALVLTGKQTAAERMIQTLSTFYRRSLAGDPTGDLPLAEEIGLQKLYLEIEGLRFPERLRTAITVPDELADVPVPGMILQPLVENAVKHAVAVSSRPVTLAIAARAEADRLILAVSDDGPGVARPQDGCGIGLANVRERLQARFDGAAALAAGALPEGGYRAEIRLPLERGPGQRSHD